MASPACSSFLRNAAAQWVFSRTSAFPGLVASYWTLLTPSGDAHPLAVRRPTSTQTPGYQPAKFAPRHSAVPQCGEARRSESIRSWQSDAIHSP
ncbi:hypothetical protein BV20DRAFT_128680 [Pilatotrama ljubarskyi]|nr:hypothetical protein BV20DRAFT_128680 [Pilatotrama ljubarskyi]